MGKLKKDYVLRMSIANILATIPPEHRIQEVMKNTPGRIAEMYRELFEGYHQDPKKILQAQFDEVTMMVISQGIEFFSLCEHHLLPFFGTVDIGYLPHERVVGTSKLPRLVNCFAHRLQLQERMTQQIAKALDESVKPKGCMVVVEGTHLCQTMRGVKNRGKMITSAIRGVFWMDSPRQEFLMLTGRRM